MRPGLVLDPATGLPKVEAIRTNDGMLIFGYHTVRPGGMSVLADVPAEALAGRVGDPSEAGELAERIREAAAAVARTIAERDDVGAVPTAGVGSVPENLDRDLEVEELTAAKQKAEARVETADEQLAEKDVENADLAERLAAAEAERDAALKAKPPARRRPRAAA